MRGQIFSAALGLLAVVMTGTPADAQNHARTAACGDSDFLPNQIRCFLDAAESEGDVSLCEVAYDFAVRFNCIALFAEHSGDPVSCGRIPLRNNRMLVFRDSCISGVAAATRTPKLCEQVQLEMVRNACFLTQVVDLGAAPDLCRHITKSAVRELCSQPQAKPQ